MNPKHENAKTSKLKMKDSREIQSMATRRQCIPTTRRPYSQPWGVSSLNSACFDSASDSFSSSRRIRRFVVSSRLLVSLHLLTFLLVLGNVRSDATLNLDCDPCIDRSQYTIQAIVHGNMNNDTTSTWGQALSSFQQTADSLGVNVLITEMSSSLTANMSDAINAAAQNQDVDALIVTIPDNDVAATVQSVVGMKPIFGMNVGGLALARKLELDGYIGGGEDDVLVGQLAATQFLSFYSTSKSKTTSSSSSSSLIRAIGGFTINNTTLLNSAVYVEAVTEPAFVVDNQYRSFSDELRKAGIYITQRVQVDPNDSAEHANIIDLLFQGGCPYPAILLNSKESVATAVSARDKFNCTTSTQIGVTQTSSATYLELAKGTLLFAIDAQQTYLQSSLAVILTTIYVTTGLKLPLPSTSPSSNGGSSTMSLTTGPIVYTKDTLPSDTIQECQAAAFPICPASSTSSSNSTRFLADSTTSDWKKFDCACIDRSKIQLGGALHGVTTDTFWDPVFLAAEQAALDMGVSLDLKRLDPADEGISFIEQEMAAKIKTLCESNVDGVFVSIPGNKTSPVVDSIKICQKYNVPVISVNSGFGISRELNLLNHIGQDEYTKGYDSGVALLKAGMQYGFCLNHETGNVALEQRCQGFKDAIDAAANETTSSGIQYIGEFPVPFDSKIKYKIQVESIVTSSISATDLNDDWAGVGMLLCSQTQLDAFRDLKSNHSALVAGTFDFSQEAIDAIDDNVILFTSDQQQYFQGSLPIYLLTHYVQSKQTLLRTVNETSLIDTGASLVTEGQNDAEVKCAANKYKVCPAVDDTNTENNGGDNSNVTVSSFLPVVNLDCDPCIDRTQYTISAILHGDESDPNWQQVAASMKQAAIDMRLKFQITLQKPGANNMAKQIRQAAFDPTVSVLIVTIPDSDVEETIREVTQQQRKPVYGMNVGYQLAQSLGLQGYIGQNDNGTGETAAQAFMDHFKGSPITSAVYVGTDNQVQYTKQFQLETFQTTLGSSVTVESVSVDTSDATNHAAAMEKLFAKCPYQVVFLSSEESVSDAVEKKNKHNCDTTQIGVAGVNRMIYQYLTKDTLLVGIDHQLHLQGAATVILASLFASTGKKLSLPRGTTYLSKAVAITNKNVPSDTVQICQSEAFPVCNDKKQANIPLGEGKCSCTDRSIIEIAGVLHGDTADKFWDPVFSSAKQAALDMGIKLTLDRLSPVTNTTLIYEKMAENIRTLCASGINGLFVTIPSDIVTQAIKKCNDLGVPVISINTGEKASSELKLPHHIAQIEFSAGYEAAVKLAEAGMKVGVCLNHAPDNPATIERCEGFQKGIDDLNSDVQYKGQFPVPEDNKAQYLIDVDKAVGEKGDWDGIGILSLGLRQVDHLQDVQTAHPKVIVGTFDVSTLVSDLVQEGWLKFGIDQQPFLQGNLPVYLLTYIASNNQALWDQKIESGPSFVESPPSDAEVICQNILFGVCPATPFEEMNYIAPSLKIFGYVMFSIIGIMCLGTGIWIYVYRNQWVVKVSQPPLLGLVIIGCFVSSLSILFLGVQTSYRNLQDPTTRLDTGPSNPDIQKADASCMAFPWLYGMGFVLSFSALFAKIHRVKMIYRAGMRMQRKTIGFQDVAYVVAFLLTIELAILTTWQIVSPLKWKREVLVFENGYPIESVGGCTYEDGWYFFAILVGFHVICLFYALALCFQTKDINSDFAESSYISLAVAFMFQVLVLSVPICALVQNLTYVFYFVRVCAVFFQNFTVMALIFIPKMIKHHYGAKDNNGVPSDGFTRGKNNLNKSRLTLAPGDPSRHMLMSEQMTSRVVSAHGFQGLSESDFRQSGSGGRNHLSEELYLSESEKISRASAVDDKPERKPSTKLTDMLLSSELGLERASNHKPKVSFKADDPATVAEAASHLSPSNVLRDWEALGFKSEEQAKKVLALLSTEITPEERQKLLKHFESPDPEELN